MNKKNTTGPAARKDSHTVRTGRASAAPANGRVILSARSAHGNGNGHQKNGATKSNGASKSGKDLVAAATAELNEKALAYAQAVLDAVPPLLVLDPKLRVVTANESFYNHFQVAADKTEKCLVYDLGNGQWNIPQLRHFLEEILPQKKSFKNFEVTHEFRDLGRRTMMLSGHQVDHLQLILVLVNDITQERNTEGAMRSSEIRYRRLFEAARDGILMVDPVTRKITEANPFMTELLEYPHDELIGKELWEIGLLKDQASSQAAFCELKDKHFIRYEDLPLENKSGRRREVEFVSNVYKESNREVIQCNIRDITERKRGEDAVKTSEERYRTLFDSIDEGFCIVEMIFDERKKAVDYRFLEVNPSFEKQAGIPQATGKRMREIVPDFEEYWFEALGQVALTGEPIRFVNQAKGLDQRWFDVYAFRLGEARQHKVAILFSNVTERKESEKALFVAYDVIRGHATQLENVVSQRTLQLKETVVELEAFSYSVSHDMRAPLRAMQGYADLVSQGYAEKPLDAKGQEFLHRISRASARLDHLIQDVLTYTNVLRAEAPLITVDLDRLVRDIIETQPKADNEARIEIQGFLPAVLGNQALLTQCLSNILSNAVKFVSPGTIPKVRIRTETLDSKIKLWIEDNGVGIDPKDHARIFRMFERVHPTSQFEGTGIGLTIVRKAAERMHAEIGFESELGQGTRFWILLLKTHSL